MRRLRALLREPLVQFLALGAALFAASVPVGNRPGGDDRIVVPVGRIEQLAAGFARTWRRPPTQEELRGLVEDFVREELASREATAMGLDRDDAIIRRRLRQKLEFLTDDLTEAEPSDEELRAFMAAHPGDYHREPRVAFRQVFVSPKKHGRAAARDAARLLDRLRAGELDPDVAGDPIMLDDRLPLSPRSEVARLFGDGFAAQVVQLPEGSWEGPLTSGYGMHLVRVEARDEGRDSDLTEVRDAVRRDWLADRGRRARDAYYEALRRRHHVVIEWPSPTPSS
jgi:PPIC-type PPIASE domain